MKSLKLWKIIIILLLSIGLFSCNSNGSTNLNQVSNNNKSSEYSPPIISFSINGFPGVIDGTNITVDLPRNTDLTQLVAKWEIGINKSLKNNLKTGVGQGALRVTVNGVIQTSGITINNFTNPVVYVVSIAGTKDTKQSYTVTTTIAGGSKKSITAFSLNNIPGVIIGQNISVTVPYGTDVRSLIATFTTDGTNVVLGSTPQISGVTINNFTTPLTYTVIAADGSTNSYTIVVTIARSPANAITVFSLNGTPATIIGQNISVTVPYGTDVKNLIATFTTDGVNVKVGDTLQVNGSTSNNFTNPVIYTVIAADGSINNYTVAVTIAGPPANAITAFLLNGTPATIIGQNISVTVPYGTDITNLIATFTTAGEKVKIGDTLQVNGSTSNNFTDPVIYTVVAADGSTNNYKVTVNIAKSPAKAITKFSLNGTLGTISDQNISVTMPFGTNLTTLIATFTTTAESVRVNNIIQVSGNTPNDFTNYVVYTVTAADGSSNNYTVFVTVAESPANTITAFALNGTPGTITDKNIAVTMPFGTSLTALIATFTTTGQSVNIGGIPQVSGNTPNNFTSPIIYTVVASNGSTNTYTVTVTIAGSPANAITAFALNGIPGTINDKNIIVTMPLGTNLTALIATFSTTGQTVSVGDITQVSGNTPNDFTKPVNYTVSAANGAVSIYTVTVTSLFSCVADGSNQCGCLTQNDNSNLMWYADGSMNGKWSDWCSTTNGNCVVTGSKLASFNAANHCGHNDWHLPSVINPTDNSYISQAGGEWGTLATYAKNNGFKNGQPFYIWLKNNQFKGIQSSTYWSSLSYNTNYVWDVVMYKERVSYDYTGPTIWGVLLVRN